MRVACMLMELLYQIALTRIPHIGNVHARILADHFPLASAIFHAPASQLEKIEGIGRVRARSIRQFSAFNDIEKEIRFIEKYQVRALFIRDPDYPQRLLNCYDPPVLLFYKGRASLNAGKAVAIIGTRHHTEYGRQMTEKLVSELAPYDVLVISGLALGVDAMAHRAAIKNNLRTAGVLAHGLDTIYPSEHISLAKEMIRTGGGLLTEFAVRTKPDKHHFPIRNRIVAGMSDAVVVTETGIKGGSMITAELANSYHKDVFAYPGRSVDPRSAGCNELIRNHKAILLTDARQLVEMMGWGEPVRKTGPPQKELFAELNEEEKIIVSLLQEKPVVSIDELNIRSGLSHSTVAATILNLEIRLIITSLPGKLYRLA